MPAERPKSMSMKTFSNVPRAGENKTAVRCPVCSEERVRHYRDFGTYSFQKCLGCGHIYQNPMPTPQDLENRYGEQYRDYELENAENFLNLMLLGLRDLGYYDLEPGFPTERRFLDVGCATGALVQYMENRGWTAAGTEICEESAVYGRTERGVQVYTCTLDKIPLEPGSLDLVHSSHVIEHVPSPVDFVNDIHSLLKPGGYCVTVTPNVASLQERLFKHEWRSAIADHVNLFSVKGLLSLHERAGLKPVKWVTWGGLAVGSAPAWLKRPVDKLIKKTPWGDVVALLSRKAF